MKTLNKDKSWSAELGTYLRNHESTPRPKIGDDDGISNGKMNIVIVLFTLLTIGVTVLAANAAGNEDVKYRILLRQAMLDIDRMDFDKAIVKLLEVRSNTDDNANVDHLLGMSYLYGEVSAEKAVYYLSRAASEATVDYEEWDLDETRAPIETVYMLAKAYEVTEHFDMAADFYSQFLASLNEDQLDKESRTYGIINRSAVECRLAAAQQAGVNSSDNVVLGQ